MAFKLFAILQKYDFSSKSQRTQNTALTETCCLRYCKSTIFQANHNRRCRVRPELAVVCDTAKVRFFKQITTKFFLDVLRALLFAILQKYDFSSKSQLVLVCYNNNAVVCDTAKVRFFKQITTADERSVRRWRLFAILQKYDFSSKSQLNCRLSNVNNGCLRYCKSTIFQANHNKRVDFPNSLSVVCDTAKVRFFKQITT